MQIVFASANKNKIKEINALLTGFEVLGLNDIGIFSEIPEPGASIKENAYLKAVYVANHLAQKALALPVFADDSGLEVTVLDNAPGVYSARYAGLPKNDEANNQKLLQELRLKTNRAARFVTVIALVWSNEAHYFEGQINGTIAFTPRGNTGFGYDPLFVPRGYRSTFAELGPDIKNSISHRAMAIKNMVAYLSSHPFQSISSPCKMPK